MEEILKAREARSNLVNSLLETDNVIIIKANVIGMDKSPAYAYFLLDIFLNSVLKLIKEARVSFYESMDGPFYLILTKAEPRSLKEELIDLEDNHPLGRLIDLDLYSLAGSLSRRDLNYGFRKCLICEQIAIKCMRESRHSLADLKKEIESRLRLYLKNLIKNSLDQAITLEAKLDPKFGLVTPYSRGSHQDMDYELLMTSKKVILLDLVDMFFFGFDNHLDLGFEKARKLGLETEKQMYRATNGVNTYKGLIFILGCLLVALGYSLKNREKSLFKNIKMLGRNLVRELETELQTFGKYAYEQYGFLGARGAIAGGLEEVRRAKDLIFDLSSETLFMVLVFLIKNTEDTVLLKRSKTLEKYEYFKNLVGSIKTYDLDTLQTITNECIGENISFGGSADLLVASIFIRLIEWELGVEYE